MEVSEAEQIVKDAKIAEPETLCFFAAVIIFIGGDLDLDLIYKETGYGYDDIATILTNWLEQEVIVNGVMELEMGDDPLEQVVELTLISLCGAGEVKRQKQEKMKLDYFNVKEGKFNSQIKKEKVMRKTLNDHLFDQLERLSDADSDSIETEMNKANTIIAVSEQILNVARLKLDIIQTGEGMVNQFAEIDNSEPKQLPISEKFDKKEAEVVADIQNKVLEENKETVSINFQEFVGSRIKIFNGEADTYWAEAELIDFMDDTLYLRSAILWNGKRKSEADIHSKFVTRIETVLD